MKSEPNPTDVHVGRRIRMRRMMIGMSQEKLGDALGITFQQIQKYEKGTNRVSASKLQQIAQFLQVPEAFFFEGAPAAKTGGTPSAENVSPAYIDDFLATSDGLRLAKVFMRIEDVKLRHMLVNVFEHVVTAQSRKRSLDAA